MDSKIQRELYQLELDMRDLSKRAIELSEKLENDNSERPEGRELFSRCMKTASEHLFLDSVKIHIIAL